MHQDSYVIDKSRLTLEKALGLIVTQQRLRKGWNQVDLAAMTGFAKRSIGAIERGEASPTLRTIEALAAAFEVPIERLIHQAARLRMKQQK
jgi:transcriptional regulator with XRE-family HTH domain